MRVLHVTRQFYPAVGGIESYVLNLSREQLSAGLHIEVLTLNRLLTQRDTILINRELVSGIPVHRIPFMGSSRYAFAPRVLTEIGDFDIVHIHSSDFFLDYLAFSRFIHRKPLVLTTHGFFFHSQFASNLKSIYFKTITKAALKKMSAVICVSRFDMQRLQSIHSDQNTYLIPIGINRPTTLFLERDNKKIISVGRLSANKRCERLLQAFKIVLASESTAKLVFVGKDFGEGNRLRKLAASLGIENSITFTGEITNDELAIELATASVWVSASEYEAFGVALLESMAAGCIPVVSNISAFTELVTDHINGFITDFSKPAKAAKCILDAFRLTEEDREKIINANRIKTKGYAWSEISNKITQIYTQVLS